MTQEKFYAEKKLFILNELELNEDIEKLGTRERLESGISFIPEDRQLQAMIMDMNLTNNVIIGRQNIKKYKK